MMRDLDDGMDPEIRLLAAVVIQAARDSRGGDPEALEFMLAMVPRQVVQRLVIEQGPAKPSCVFGGSAVVSGRKTNFWTVEVGP